MNVNSKLIYVVNGQIELASPETRQAPFISAPDDVNTFSENEGLIIWTPDFFKILKTLYTGSSQSDIRKSIRESKGRWPSQ
jgi:hypothetical protein